MLDEIVSDGARRMLAAALQTEVAASIKAHADHDHRLVVRNGSVLPREVVNGADAVIVAAPRSTSGGVWTTPACPETQRC